jgi:Replication initiator protein A
LTDWQACESPPTFAPTGFRQREGFGLIGFRKIIEKHSANGRMVAAEWRLYELARKHCGHQTKWRISPELPHKKSGTTGRLSFKIMGREEHETRPGSNQQRKRAGATGGVLISIWANGLLAWMSMFHFCDAKH